MNESLNRKARALGAFTAMGSIPDRFVAAAEDTLFEIEAGLSAPPRPTSPFRRFLHSGWCAAAAAGLVVLGVAGFLIRGEPFSTTVQPAHSPSGSTISMSNEEAPFIVSTEYKQYMPGDTSITLIITTASPGMPIQMHNAWHLERSTGQGYEVVEIVYTEEAIEALPSTAEDYATITKTIRIPDGLKAGEYRLHATEHDGEKYVSISFCDFVVSDGIQDEVDFTLSTDSPSYSEGITSFVVTLTGKNPGEEINLPDEWNLFRVTDEGNEPVIGMYYTSEAMSGIAPDENTCATLSKRIFINPQNGGQGLSAGRYILRAVTAEGYVEVEFTVNGAVNR